MLDYHLAENQNLKNLEEFERISEVTVLLKNGRLCWIFLKCLQKFNGKKNAYIVGVGEGPEIFLLITTRCTLFITHLTNRAKTHNIRFDTFGPIH